MRFAASILLVCSLASWSCRSREAASVRIDSSLARLVPADTVVLVNARVDELRETPLYRNWIARHWSSEFDRLTQNTGFDLRKDLSEILVASNGKAAVVMAKGKFSVSNLESKAGDSGAARMPYKGRILFGSEQTATVFLDGTTALAGPAPALRSVIDNKDRSGGIPAGLLEKAKSVAAGNQVWAVSVGSPIPVDAIPETSNLSNLRRILATVESTAFGFDLRAGLKAQATGVYRTEEDAKFIHDALRGLVGMGRLTTPDNQPEMLRFYDGISIQQQRTMVLVKADIPTDVLEKFLARMQSLKKAD